MSGEATTSALVPPSDPRATVPCPACLAPVLVARHPSAHNPVAVAVDPVQSGALVLFLRAGVLWAEGYDDRERFHQSLKRYNAHAWQLAPTKRLGVMDLDLVPTCEAAKAMLAPRVKRTVTPERLEVIRERNRLAFFSAMLTRLLNAPGFELQTKTGIALLWGYSRLVQGAENKIMLEVAASQFAGESEVPLEPDLGLDGLEWFRTRDNVRVFYLERAKRGAGMRAGYYYVPALDMRLPSGRPLLEALTGEPPDDAHTCVECSEEWVNAANGVTVCRSCEAKTQE